MASELEEAYGLHKSPEDYDRLMFSFIRKDWQEYEGPLFTTKWFDYRHLHPVAASYVFAHCLVKAYQRAYRRTISNKGWDAMRPLKSIDLFRCPKNQIGGVWRGRQHADAMGAPYPVYLEFAYEAALRYWKRGHLPTPQQLYSEHVIQRVTEQWEDRQKGFMLFSEQAAYRNENYIGTRAQDDHHAWLFEQIGKRQNGFIPLENLFKRGLLPADKIEAQYGRGMIDRLTQH